MTVHRELHTRQGTGEARAWPLPRLRKLSVLARVKSNVLLDTIKNRHSRNSDIGIAGPTKLSALHISGETSYLTVIYDQLKAILNDGSVTWDHYQPQRTVRNMSYDDYDGEIAYVVEPPDLYVHQDVGDWDSDDEGYDFDPYY